jgi:uncharacterized membrane protein YccC
MRALGGEKRSMVSAPSNIEQRSAVVRALDYVHRLYPRRSNERCYEDRLDDFRATELRTKAQRLAAQIRRDSTVLRDHEVAERAREAAIRFAEDVVNTRRAIFPWEFQDLK